MSNTLGKQKGNRMAGALTSLRSVKSSYWEVTSLSSKVVIWSQLYKNTRKF